MTHRIFCTDLTDATDRALDLLDSAFLEKEWNCTGNDLTDTFSITDAIHYIDKHYDVLSHMDAKQLAQELARYTMSQLPALVTRVRGYSSQGLDEPPFIPEASPEASAFDALFASSDSSLFE